MKNEYPKLMEVSNNGRDWFTAIALNKIGSIYYVLYGDSIESIKKEPHYNLTLRFHDENFAREIDHFKELKEAYNQGKTIQGKHINSKKWIDLKSPSWNCMPDEYRIKPVPKYIPFDFSDIDKLLGKGVKCDVVAFIINRVGTDFVANDSVGTISFKDLFNHYTFLDGSPCGKLK